jgi:hypothetical protein
LLGIKYLPTSSNTSSGLKPVVFVNGQNQDPHPLLTVHHIIKKSYKDLYISMVQAYSSCPEVKFVKNFSIQGLGLTLDFLGRIEEAGILVYLKYEPVLNIVGENF